MTKRPILIGLTGSIGMGKSTAAQIFREFGIPVWDADRAVHEIYAPGGAAVDPISKMRPEAVGPQGVSRTALTAWIGEDTDALARIEEIVHPLVAEARNRFIASTTSDMLVLDIPLLFETGETDKMDIVVVVSAPAEIQRARVLAREGMTESQFDRILRRQMPDSEKRAHADVVVPSLTMEETRGRIRKLIEDIRAEHA